MPPFHQPFDLLNRQQRQRPLARRRSPCTAALVRCYHKGLAPIEPGDAEHAFGASGRMSCFREQRITLPRFAVGQYPRKGPRLHTRQIAYRMIAKGIGMNGFPPKLLSDIFHVPHVDPLAKGEMRKPCIFTREPIITKGEDDLVGSNDLFQPVGEDLPLHWRRIFKTRDIRHEAHQIQHLVIGWSCTVRHLLAFGGDNISTKATCPVMGLCSFTKGIAMHGRQYFNLYIPSTWGIAFRCRECI